MLMKHCDVLTSKSFIFFFLFIDECNQILQYGINKWWAINSSRSIIIFFRNFGICLEFVLTATFKFMLELLLIVYLFFGEHVCRFFCALSYTWKTKKGTSFWTNPVHLLFKSYGDFKSCASTNSATLPKKFALSKRSWM